MTTGKVERGRRWPGSLGLVCVLVFASCCGQRFARREQAGRKHVGIVYDIGGKDDKSFNQAAYIGGKRAAKDLPIALRDVEPGDPTAIEPSMRAFAERGYDLIIGVGFAQAPVVASVARDYPNLKFAIVDGNVDLPNVASLTFREQEGAFLVGMIAGDTTRTKKVGFVGGMDIPLIHRFESGYEQGAHFADPGVEVFQNYVGVTDSAWNNPGRGKELALAQINRGADVVFQAAGNSGMGVFDAAEETRTLVIGVDSNQNWIKPGYVLTSMIKRVDVAVYDTIKGLVAGRFEPGLRQYGLENDGVGYALDQYNKALISATVLDRVESAKRDIISGKIAVKVP